jgi:hypothetical protein
MQSQEEWACTPDPVKASFLNPLASIPYGCSTEHVLKGMMDFCSFLGFVNQQLYAHELPRLESFLMPANFSSIVGEFMAMTIPKHCSTLARNTYHNGHPDLVPVGLFPNNAAQYAHEGIEVKASRYPRGWQGHNAEASWLLVFVFDANGVRDYNRGIAPRPFKFLRVLGAQLIEADWQFSGRTGLSRRTITASVRPSGFNKMIANVIYEHP